MPYLVRQRDLRLLYILSQECRPLCRHVLTTAKPSSLSKAAGTAGGLTVLLLLNLRPVLPTSLSIFFKRVVSFQIFREEIEIFTPCDIGTVHDVVLFGEQVEFVIGKGEIIVSIMHRLVI